MKTTIFRNDSLKLLLNATPIANLADNAATAPLTALFLGLCSAWPGLAGDQSTNETAYTGYARQSVARTTGGWACGAGNAATLVATQSFGACTAGSATATHFTLGTLVSGTGKILRMGVIGSRLGAFTAIAAGNSFKIPGLTGLAVNERIVFHSVDGTTLPGGVTEGTSYFVITVATDDITVSATQGGASITISSAGDGIAYKSTPIVITSAPSVNPQLGTATTIYEE